MDRSRPAAVRRDRTPARTTRRVPPPAGASPLVATASSSNGKGGQDRTVSGEKCPIPNRGFGSKGRSGSDTFRAPDAGNPDRNPGRNPGSLRARGKRTPEPQNPGRPPTPSGRSSPDSILVEQTYVTDHGQTATNDPHRSRRSATRPRGQVTATRLISATSSGSLVRSRAKPVAEAPGADHERRRRTLH